MFPVCGWCGKDIFMSDADIYGPWFHFLPHTADSSVTGVSTYNVNPPRAGLYFHKIQCFCFEEQRLRPHEEIDMPVSRTVSQPAVCVRTWICRSQSASRPAVRMCEPISTGECIRAPCCPKVSLFLVHSQFLCKPYDQLPVSIAVTSPSTPPLPALYRCSSMWIPPCWTTPRWRA